MIIIMSRQLAVIAILILTLLSVESVSAQDFYRWVDKNGRVFYGSKPPAQANDVSGLKSRTLSKYSSKRMLKHMGWQGEEQANIKNPKAANKSKAVTNSPAELEQGELKIEVDEKQKVTVCKVSIVNKNQEKTAREISVAFEFADGTLIPGVGPQEIAANSAAEFTVPNELLPLTIKSEEDTVPPPQIIIYGAAE